MAQHTMDVMRRIELLTEHFRGYINSPRIQWDLLKDKPKWLQICSSLDAIEDAELAVAAYYKRDRGRDSGSLYLAVYGLLQACFLQQDAVFNLCEALCINDDVRNYRALVEVRDLRNSAVGHPTKQGRKAPFKFSFVTRTTLTKTSLELLTTDGLGTTSNRCVDIAQLGRQQRTYISRALVKAVRDLKRQDSEHRRSHRAEKLVDLLPQSLDWALGKISEAAGDSGDPFAHAGIATAKKCLDDLEAALEKRGLSIETYDAVNYLYQKVSYPLSRISQWINRQRGADKEEITIFVWYLRENFRELRGVVEEIDKEYAQ